MSCEMFQEGVCSISEKTMNPEDAFYFYVFNITTPVILIASFFHSFLTTSLHLLRIYFGVLTEEVSNHISNELNLGSLMSLSVV